MAKYLDQAGLTYFWGKIKGFVNSHEHPVGSVYITISSSFNPATQWGGTWSKIAEGQCLISAGNTYKIGGNYGENTHTLSGDEMPSLTHTYSPVWVTETSYNTGVFGIRGEGSPSYAGGMGYSGSGEAMNLMQKSLAVNIWKRTA